MKDKEKSITPERLLSLMSENGKTIKECFEILEETEGKRDLSLMIGNIIRYESSFLKKKGDTADINIMTEFGEFNIRINHEDVKNNETNH